MSVVFWGALALGIAAPSVAAAGHALAWKRDPRSALGWIAVSFLLPLLGPLLYLVFGVNRVRRTARQWQAAGRRLTGTGAFGAASAVALPGAGEQRGQGGAPGEEVRRCAAARVQDRGAVRRHRDRRPPKGTWVRISRPTVEGKVVRGFEGMDVGDRVRVELVRTDVERGFIDFKRSAEVP